MNNKLKCVLAVLLVLVMAMSAFVVLPATAAENDSPEALAAQSDTVDLQVMDETEEGEVYSGNSFGESFTEAIELAAVGSDAELANEGDNPVVEGVTEAPTEAPVYDPNTVGAITTVTRTTNESTELGLSWNEVPDAEGYHIYWRNGDNADSSYILLTTVKDNSLTIRNLKAGVMYLVKVAAYKTSSGKIIEGPSKIVKAATVPGSVSNFRITAITNKAIALEWKATPLCDGYIIYRKSGGVWENYKVYGKNVTAFSDKNLNAGSAYFYNIVPYRRDIGGTIKGTGSRINAVCGLKAPEDNGTKILLRKVYLNWTKIKYANGYDIYSSTNNKDFKLLSTTKSTSFITHRLQDDKTYYFRVYPYRLVGTSKTKVVGTYYGKAYKVYNSAFGKKVPDTYIEVSLDQQHMWFYVDNKLYVSTDVVTGNYNSMDTPRGYWSINNKSRNTSLVGANYVSFVQYWMAFIGSGYGIHDASWRSSFGGTIYKGNGSHGCINTPLANVKKIYSKAKVGTPVIVY